ncbi:hypothetical protein Hanom_Chr17g01552361 [Helianthus anomalus]
MGPRPKPTPKPKPPGWCLGRFTQPTPKPPPHTPRPNITKETRGIPCRAMRDLQARFI